MSENWKYQLSLKINGVHLLNLRADTADEMVGQVAWAEENKEPILIACAALEGTQKPEPKRPASLPPNVPVGLRDGDMHELGPLVLENVEIKRAGKDGTLWKSPMFILKFDGTSASTFDQLIGKAAQGFWTQGNACYLTVAPSPKNPKFNNVVSIRSAVAS